MPTFEVEGPCPDGDFFVVRVEVLGGERHHHCLAEMYATREEADAAADRFNADPDSAPSE